MTSASFENLECLRPMRQYQELVLESVNYLSSANGKRDGKKHTFKKMDPGAVKEYRRYVNSDLQNFSLEFYLQRKGWAEKCIERGCTLERRCDDERDHSQHPCLMHSGFSEIVSSGNTEAFGYEQFLGEATSIFLAMHAHLVSINRALGYLYYFVTELPFASFTDIGKAEIGKLTADLESIMEGLWAATHLQPFAPSQTDLPSYLVSCRTDCQRLLEAIPRFYQSHRLRLVIFGIDPQPEPKKTDPRERKRAHQFPIACLPTSAGVYLDFLASYTNIARHALAVIHWSIRLYSLWYFVPRRMMRFVGPEFVT